jgi:hypothetical protein
MTQTRFLVTAQAVSNRHRPRQCSGATSANLTQW